jgi:hypothetical protein
VVRAGLEDGEQERVEVAFQQFRSHWQHQRHLLEILSVSAQRHWCSVAIVCVATYDVSGCRGS